MDNKYDITHITAENIKKYLSSIHLGHLIKFKQFARLTQLGATLRVACRCITHAHLCPCDPFSCLPRISFCYIYLCISSGAMHYPSISPRGLYSTLFQEKPP